MVLLVRLLVIWFLLVDAFVVVVVAVFGDPLRRRTAVEEKVARIVFRNTRQLQSGLV